MGALILVFWSTALGLWTMKWEVNFSFTWKANISNSDIVCTFQVLRLGFKSVAHYLIQTRRSQSKLEDSVTETMDSLDGSLPSEVLDAEKSTSEFSEPQPDCIDDNNKMEENEKNEVDA